MDLLRCSWVHHTCLHCCRWLHAAEHEGNECCRCPRVIGWACRTACMYKSCTLSSRVCDLWGFARWKRGRTWHGNGEGRAHMSVLVAMSSIAQPRAMVSHTTGLKKITPYWHPYRTMAKERWYNREILELVSTEFRDRSVEYYVRVPLDFTCCPHAPQAVCARVWRHDHQWQAGEAWHDCKEWRSHRVGISPICRPA